jgi:transposase
MNPVLEKLPEDPGKLKEIVASLVSEQNQIRASYNRSELRVRLLEEEVAHLRAKLYGPRTEKRALNSIMPGQGSFFELLGETPPAAEEVPVIEDGDVKVAAHSRKKKGRKPLPEDLPREEVVHDIPEEEKICSCGCEMERIGEEVSEVLHYQKAELKVIRHTRPKYACKNCEGSSEEEKPSVKIAPPPPQLIPKSFAAISLLIYIIIGKFVDALPLYRMEQQFKRMRVELSRKTMSKWMIRVADRCQPLIPLLQEEIRSGPLINIDETTLQVMQEKGRQNKTKSYVWIFRGHAEERPAVVFEYHPTRSGQAAVDFCKGYVGYVQSDGYSGYNYLEKEDGITLCGCWAHARRKFFDASRAGKKTTGKTRGADTGLAFITELYKLEKNAKKAGLSPEQIHQMRQEQAKPILDKFGLWLRDTYPRTPGKGLLGQAIAYTLNNWKRLIVYIEDSSLTPDNNAAENAIRPFVVGRKNWLFSGSPAGAHASAIFFSLIETAKLNQLNPESYMRFLLEKLTSAGDDVDFKELLPTRVTNEQIEDFLKTLS